MAVDGLRRGAATPHDEVVAEQLGRGALGRRNRRHDTVGEDELLALEREAFMALIKHPATLARIEHMLETGKPLRN